MKGMEEFKDKVSLAAAIIARNETGNIEECIESIREVCSQIVVVDTGSEDNTALIAQRLGSEIYFRKWDEDFSAARNFALAHLRMEWNLAIDADERLNAESLINNSELFDQKKTGGILVKIKSDLQDGTYSIHTYSRIFRNMPEIRYKGAIHEQVRPSIESAGLEIVESDILIEHKGYSSKLEDKVERNRKMIQHQLREEPDSGYLQMHLAEAEFTGKNFREAEKLYKKALESGTLKQIQADRAYIRLGQICLVDSRHDEIESYLDFSSGDTHLEGLRKYVLAASKLDFHKFESSFELFSSKEVLESSLVDNNNVERALAAIGKILGRE